jgi:1,4-dihydroxy-2-naphthoate octaprenyltransferase
MDNLTSRLKRELSLLAQLGRLRMTIFSAVTYSTAFSLALHFDFGSKLDVIPFQTSDFLFGWAFILSCQLSAHFLGEYSDFKSDSLNSHASPFTGGSRILVNGGYSPTRCLLLGWSCCISSFLILQFILPNRIHLIGYFMIFLACQYSGAPLKFSHHALGELSAALVMNVLLPYFAASLASASFHFLDNRLALLVIPSALIKFGLFIVLNVADRRADWLAHKITLPVTQKNIVFLLIFLGFTWRSNFSSNLRFLHIFRLFIDDFDLFLEFYF